jgi:diguanylate cyclase (GGDEF)-like protein
VLLPETSAATATVVAERIRKQIETTAIQAKEGNVSITASFGVSDHLMLPDEMPREKVSAEFIAYADRALYMSKNSGKNRVTVYNPNNDHENSFP